ncbi:MAG: nitroreductase family protein, partial [Parasporobacterium sp.]|nr:nitroreductase family protein [Parasporobacterium sp.]
MNVKSILSGIKRIITRQTTHVTVERYYKSFVKHSFVDGKCTSPEQFEASVTRLYHTIEKGLSYEDYRAGFGKDNVDMLILSLEQYATNGFDISAFFYETALSCLKEYVRKNREHGHEDKELEQRIAKLSGNANEFGGTVIVSAPAKTEVLSYEQLTIHRHSIRNFSDIPVDLGLLKDAIKLAQFTPSACNRQGWKTRIIADKGKIKTILANQNGNRGFGHEFDK